MESDQNNQSDKSDKSPGPSPRGQDDVPSPRGQDDVPGANASPNASPRGGNAGASGSGDAPGAGDASAAGGQESSGAGGEVALPLAIPVDNAGDRSGSSPRNNAGERQDQLAVRQPDALADSGRSQSSWRQALDRVHTLAVSAPSVPGVPEKVKDVAFFDCQGNCMRIAKALPSFYAEKLALFHWAFLLFWSVVMIISMSAAWRPVEISTNLDRFHQVDAPASVNRSVYLEATKFMREVRDPMLLADRESFQITVYYEAKSGSVLEEATLRDIRSFEHQLMSLEGWQRLCNQGDPRAHFRCAPGESFGNYVWPKRLDNFLNEDGIFRLDFDGSATERLPVPSVLAYLSEGAAAPHDLSKFLARGIDQDDASKAHVLRSIFTFTSPTLGDQEYAQAYKDFVDQELYPELLKAAEKAKEPLDPDSWDEPSHIRIYFSGEDIDAHEVKTALEDDVRHAAGALVLSFLIAWVRLKSCFLAFSGTLLICMAVLQTYVMTPAVEEVGLASFLGVFLLFGLSSNTLFYMHDVWQHSRTLGEKSRSVDGRVASLAKRIGAVHKKAALQLLPIFFTGLCLLTLLISYLKPIREFGLFMSVLTVISLFLCLAVFVPLLILHEEMVRPLICKKTHRVVALLLEPVGLPWTKHCKSLAQGCIAVARRGKRVVLATVAVWVVCVAFAVGFAATNEGTGLPEVFPPSHHRNAGRPLASSFAEAKPANEPAPNTSTFCQPGRATTTDCGLYWCEAPLAPAEEALTIGNVTAIPSKPCECWRTSVVSGTSCSQVVVSALFSGKAAQDLTEEERLDSLEEYIKSQWPDTTSVSVQEVVEEGSQRRRRSQERSLVLENWESGATNLEPLVKLPTVVAAHSPSGTQSTDCPEEVICHCGPQTCQRPDTKFQEETTQLTLLSRRRLAADVEVNAAEAVTEEHEGRDAPSGTRRLDSAGSAGTGQSTEVTILFGITPPEGGSFFDATPEWSFDSRFNPSSPDAQRAMRAMCTDLPDEFNIEETECWINDFRTWLDAKGDRFPVERFGDFQSELKDFLEEYPQAAQNMWMNSAGNMTATAFRITVAPAEDVWAVLKQMKKWEEYIDKLNNMAPTVASNAWATSTAWVDAEAYDEALASSWRACLACLAGVLLAGIYYTMDMEMTFIITVIAFVDGTILSFFMYCLFQWAFGPWELIIMTVFLSFSVEPAFRIGHEFVFPCKDAVQPAVDVAEQPASGADDGAEPSALALPSPRDPPPAIEDQDDGVQERFGEELSDGSPSGSSPEECLQRSVYLLAGTVLTISVKFMICGILMGTCQFRLFARLGAVAVVGSLLWAPSTLIVMPAVILWSGRQRREPDLHVAWRYIQQKAVANWS